MTTQDIHNILENFIAKKNNYTIWIVANISDTVQDEESFIQHASFSEFFSKAEFSAIASAITEIFGYVRIFYSETEFMQHVINNLNNIHKEETIVFNFCRDGINEGKKSLVPSLCDLYGIKYTSSNAFVISLLRNKFVYTKYLSSLNIPVPFTTCSKLFDETIFLDVKGKNVIIKNIFESASIGLEESNILKVQNYNDLLFQIKQHSKKMDADNLLIQEYIPGKECEVFVIKHGNVFYAFDPIMIKINNSTIITSTISDDYDYTFLPLYNEFTVDVCRSIKRSATKAADLLNIKNYARFDYRIKENGQFYLIDIAGSPYLTRHSSIEYLFTQLLNLNYSDIFLLLAALTIENYSHEVNCRSDSGNPLDI